MRPAHYIRDLMLTVSTTHHRKYLLCFVNYGSAFLTLYWAMNGVSTSVSDVRRARYNPGVRNVVMYCAGFALFFVLTSLLVEIPIMSMMISWPRKACGIVVLVCAICFFAVFSFKSSKSYVCSVPFIFVIVLVAGPTFMLLQEPRQLFNYVHTESEALSFCKGEPFVAPEKRDQFVVFKPTETGLGNRILGLVSSYALALVTGRELLVDWETEDGLTAPFSELFRSTKVRRVSEVVGNATIDTAQYEILNLVYCRQCSIRFRHPKYATIATRDMASEFTRKFLVIRSNVYFAPLLMANKHHRALLCGILGDEESLFHKLFHELVQLAPNIQEMVDRAIAPLNGKHVVGVQIRLKDRVGFPMARVGNFFDCVQAIAARYNNSVVVIASDSDWLKANARVTFGDKFVPISSGKNGLGMKPALVDMMVLAMCNNLVLTPFSTFGAVSAAVGKIVPHFVTREEGYCVKDVSYEPKFHYWHALSLYNIPDMGSSYMINQDDSFM